MRKRFALAALATLSLGVGLSSESTAQADTQLTASAAGVQPTSQTSSDAPAAPAGPQGSGARLALASPAEAAATHQRVPERHRAPSPISIRASRGPTRIHTYPHAEQTKYVFARHNAQICFNIWGKNLRKGYTIAMWAYVGAAPLPDQQIWAQTYYGPKNKTCSPWLKVDGFPVAAAIYTNDGAKATADVWQYWS